jgi:hypothetical protein
MRTAAQFGWVFVIVVIVFWPRYALGYSGGPALVEVVGWDKQAQRVYFLEYPPVESGSFYVCSFAPASTKPGEKHVAWEELGDRRSARLDSLRRRSIPLEFRATEVLSGHIEATLQDSVEAQDMRFARFRLNVYYTGSFGGLRFRVLSYGREFVIKDVYRVPGREDFLFVVSFRGNPYGMFEETQMPLLIRKGTWDRVRELVWRPNGAWMEPKPVH